MTLTDALTRRKQSPPACAPALRPVAAGGGTPYGKAALQAECRELAAASEGERNHRLNRAAFAAGQLVAGGEVSESSALELLAGAARQCGLGDREIGATLASGLEAGKREPRSAPERSADPRVPRARFEPSDLGNGQRMAARHGRDVRYCHPWGKALIWDGRRFAIDETAELERRAKETVRSIYGEAQDTIDSSDRKRLVKWAAASESASRLSAMARLMTSEPGIPVLPREIDRAPFLLNLMNGTLDLKSGRLRAHERGDLLTKLVPIAWDEGARCPTWLNFLSDITGDSSNLIDFLQRAVGYTLTADVGEQVLFFALGKGKNGKSTFLRVLLELLGEYGTQGAPDLLLTKHGDAHPTEQADLFGRRLVVCTEIEAGRRLAEVTVKQLTGGDTIKARRMREDFWEFRPTHKIWIAANHKPIVKGTDDAIWRRLPIIPFDVRIPDDKTDPHLNEKLTVELPGILRWAVEGCLRWQRDGLGVPSEVAEATEAYRTEMDVLGGFIEECCEVLRGGTFVEWRTAASALYEAFVSWTGDRSVTQTAFGAAMTERGFHRKTLKGRRVYAGIRLREEGSDAA